MSTESQHNNKRIAKNALMLYVRMLFTLAVGLYTSRVVLKVLGVSDFGLYNVVGGIVTIFTFLNGTLTTGTQRFLSYAIGEGNKEKLKKVFDTSVILHAIVSIIILILAETVGLWLLHYKMNIPTGRETAAFWVFQFSILATVLNIMQVPYRASLVAHERMDIFAYMGIYETVMKLAIVYLLLITSIDKLIMYAFLIMMVHATAILFNILYCRKKFEECTYSFSFDKKIFGEIARFSGWNIFGCGAVSMQGQGVNILLNMFFGTVVNAARGIAFQVNNVVMQFVNNFQTAVNPQIVKLYAAGETKEMIRLVINNSKFAAYLLLVIAVPVSIELEFLLDIWLGEYPDYTPIFLRIILFQSLVQTMTRPVVMVVHAVGKMKMVNITAGGALLLILPISYVLMKFGCDPITIFLVNLIPWFFETFFELYYENKFCGFPIWRFYKEVYGRVFPLAVLMLLIPGIIHHFISLNCVLRFFVVGIVSLINSSLIILYLGINRSLRLKLFDKAKQIIYNNILRK